MLVNKHMTKIILFIFSVLIGSLIIITAYLWSAPRDSQILKPFFPKTLFSIENAPSQSLVGKVASISGNVAWQSRTASFSTLINSPVILQQGEKVNTQDNGKVTINFPQTITITASANTQLNFIQTLTANFVVDQAQGRSTYVKNGTVPISVRALDLLINVETGTCSISVDKDTASIVVAVSSGSAVVAFNDTNNVTNILTINKGEEYLFNNNTKLGKIKSL
jgi:hypothetical protein